MLTVQSSAIGPLLSAKCQAQTGKFMPALHALAAFVLALVIARYFVPLADTPTAWTVQMTADCVYLLTCWLLGSVGFCAGSQLIDLQ
jgi:hypothetical protein